MVKYNVDIFINKSNIVHNNKYDYTKTIYVSSKAKVIITCPIHGDFEQAPARHISGCGCNKCGIVNRKLTKSKFIIRGHEKHNNKYDYSLVNFEGTNDKVKIICPMHGTFEQRVAGHLFGYGCKCCATENSKINVSTFIENSNKKHNNKYDYSFINYTNSHDNFKLKIICPIHGAFEQSAKSHIQGAGCMLCAIQGRVYTNIDFINIANKKHNNKYDYSLICANYNRNKVKIICPIHDTFEQSASNHIQGSNCPKCSNTGPSIQEQDYYNYIRELLPTNVEVQQSNRTILNGKELDIYIPEYNLAIEYNGLYWHSSGDKEGDLVKRNYHLNKTKKCRVAGIELLHINEGDNVQLWKQVIKNKLGLNKRIFARKCIIKEVQNKESNTFLEINHLQGKCIASIKYGLYYGNCLISLMTFGKARYSDVDYELIRFCTLSGYTVVGGASKLLTHFKRNFPNKTIVSYANLRWSNGNLYEKLGFKFLHDSAPCYWYFNGGDKLYHRSSFMKHKLKDKLEIFNENKSEVENMYDNKYRRIWDCGNKVYILN